MQYIALGVLCAVVLVGFCTKLYTSHRLKQIDGYGGVKKKNGAEGIFVADMGEELPPNAPDPNDGLPLEEKKVWKRPTDTGKKE